ncbi:MAG: alpha-L-fucosidase [Bacteroidales bacterium]|nr:alpha-L-fucosidase [Bacteroidales bacterium]MCF8403952.1 alpha-L-fucosidase [Bacteroidales bacterium]
MKKFLFLFFLVPITIQAQDTLSGDTLAFRQKMEWFKDAKMGIFIHWGIYSVNGISESWSFFNGQIPHEDYVKQAEGFTAQNYKPEYWAGMIKESGARYSVITSKHHDGFALWDSSLGGFSAKDNSAAQKDLLSPFVNALRENNLKVGLYYSLPDWTWPDYTEHTRTIKRYRIDEAPDRWAKFLNYYQGQLKELMNRYDPDLWWFDGDWEHTAEEWDIENTRNLLTRHNPKVIFNSRLQGHGDYDTPEIGLPVMKPKAEYWELCMTMNDSWGYQHTDLNYKSPQQVMDILVDCIGKGGNLLLDIGPKADGTIPLEQENILKELGKWTGKHAEAIYGSRAGVPYEHFNGPSALSKDRKNLYLFVRDIPKDGNIIVKGISNPIKNISLVGNDTELSQKLFCKVSWNTYPGILYIQIPEDAQDDYYTVVKLELEGEINLYRENSGAIESND